MGANSAIGNRETILVSAFTILKPVVNTIPVDPLVLVIRIDFDQGEQNSFSLSQLGIALSYFELTELK